MGCYQAQHSAHSKHKALLLASVVLRGSGSSANHASSCMATCAGLSTPAPPPGARLQDHIEQPWLIRISHPYLSLKSDSLWRKKRQRNAVLRQQSLVLPNSISNLSSWILNNGLFFVFLVWMAAVLFCLLRAAEAKRCSCSMDKAVRGRDRSLSFGARFKSNSINRLLKRTEAMERVLLSGMYLLWVIPAVTGARISL